jgi:hypothetical protein
VVPVVSAGSRRATHMAPPSRPQLVSARRAYHVPHLTLQARGHETMSPCSHG